MYYTRYTRYIILHTNTRIFSPTLKIPDEDSKHPDEYFDILSEPESVGCYVHHTDSFTVRVNQLHNYIKYNKAVCIFFFKPAFFSFCHISY